MNKPTQPTVPTHLPTQKQRSEAKGARTGNLRFSVRVHHDETGDEDDQANQSDRK